MAQAGKGKSKVSSKKTSCKVLVEECRECGKEVLKGVECEVCERWFQITCVGGFNPTLLNPQLAKSHFAEMGF